MERREAVRYILFGALDANCNSRLTQTCLAVSKRARPKSLTIQAAYTASPSKNGVPILDTVVLRGHDATHGSHRFRGDNALLSAQDCGLSNVMGCVPLVAFITRRPTVCAKQTRLPSCRGRRCL